MRLVHYHPILARGCSGTWLWTWTVLGFGHIKMSLPFYCKYGADPDKREAETIIKESALRVAKNTELHSCSNDNMKWNLALISVDSSITNRYFAQKINLKIFENILVTHFMIPKDFIRASVWNVLFKFFCNEMFICRILLVWYDVLLQNGWPNASSLHILYHSI